MGFKHFVRSGESGIVYDFFCIQVLLAGKKCTSSYVVWKLLESLPKNEHFQIYFNKRFFISYITSRIETKLVNRFSYSQSRQEKKNALFLQKKIFENKEEAVNVIAQMLILVYL